LGRCSGSSRPCGAARLVVRASETSREGTETSSPAAETAAPAAVPRASARKATPVPVVVGADALAALVAVQAGAVVGGLGLGAQSAVAAVPFVVGWCGAANFASDYEPDPRMNTAVGDRPFPAARSAALTWFSGAALALALRGFLPGGNPAGCDDVTTFLVGLSLLCGLRYALAFKLSLDEEPTA